MFFNDIDNPIGLDISDLSVKLVQFRKAGSRLEVAAFADVLLPAGLMENDIVVNEQALVSFLKDLFTNRSNHSGHLRGRSIVASIPEAKAFVRVIKLPPLNAGELATAVPLEAEQYIPISVNEMQIDWQQVGRVQNGLKVFIAATPKKYVGELVNVFKKAGLVTQSLEAESAAIARALLPKEGDVPGTLILDMDATRTSLIVYGDNSIQFTSSIPIAGHAITNAVAKRLDISLEEAEHVKRLHGIPHAGASTEKVSIETGQMLSEVSLAIEPVLANLFDEVKNTIKFHEEHAEAEKIESLRIKQMILCGGTSKLPNVVDYLQGKLNSDFETAGHKIKVQLGNAWTNVEDVYRPPFSRREALSYATAIGLALRNYL